MSAEEATDDVINVQLKEVIRLKKAGQLSVENIDVFCEKGIFSVDQTKRILEAGRQDGDLRINFHAEELNWLGSAEVNASLLLFVSMRIQRPLH